MSESENILLQRFVTTGDANAFSEIVRRHAGLVYGACLRILADKDRAADAVQETFLQLLQNARTITGSVPTWLHRVATRKAIDVIRRDSSRKHLEAKYAADKPRQVAEWQELSRYVDEELDLLDEQTRSILIQHFFEGRTTSDIASVQSVSQPTVSRRIESGVGKLRGRLRKRGIIVGAGALLGLLGENAAQAAPAVVLKELGKIAIVGGQAAAATGAGAGAASASGAGAKAAAGVLAGVKAKLVTAAVVTAVGIGSVATYNHVTQPAQPEQPAAQIIAPQSTRRPAATTTSSPARTASAPVDIRTAPEDDWIQRDMDMWEQIFAEEDAKTRQAKSDPLPPPPDEGDAEPVGGMMGGGYGGMGMGAYALEPSVEEEEDGNQPPMGFGGMGGVFYGASYVPPPPPEEEDAGDEEPPERRD